MSDNITFECEYCKKTFSSKGNLSVHKKHTKYCLELQGKHIKNYICNLCDNEFTSNRNLQEHICKRDTSKYKEEIEYLKQQLYERENKHKEEIENVEIQLHEQKNYYKEEIEHLKQQLHEQEREQHYYKDQIKDLKAMLDKANETIAEIAKQPTVSNISNTTTNQNYLMMNFDIDDIDTMKEMLETCITPAVLQSGQEGVADALQHKFLTRNGEPLYECTDVSRKNFEFRNRNGDIEVDPQANRLIRNLQRSNISEIASENGKKIWTNEDGSIDYDRQHAFMPRVAEVITIKQDSTKLRNRLATITARHRKCKKK